MNRPRHEQRGGRITGHQAKRTTQLDLSSPVPRPVSSNDTHSSGIADDFGLGELADRRSAQEIRLFAALVVAATRTRRRLPQSTIDHILGVTHRRRKTVEKS